MSVIPYDSLPGHQNYDILRSSTILEESAAQGAPDQPRDAVAHKAEAMLMGGARCSTCAPMKPAMV
ncbi:hypothetical protein AYJ54_16925 [Bradyrhizobium centrolobii]|uniref:Uncharacterized protein n=1 Tax=Bradyrhizobium centrolobii TaxID=1505087 RepID=A0A176YMC8_9BRAD|nr:hypothetical protein AYJ54_16925 [Bradyrhizobium centrolobii]